MEQLISIFKINPFDTIIHFGGIAFCLIGTGAILNNADIDGTKLNKIKLFVNNSVKRVG